MLCVRPPHQGPRLIYAREHLQSNAIDFRDTQINLESSFPNYSYRESNLGPPRLAITVLFKNSGPTQNSLLFLTFY